MADGGYQVGTIARLFNLTERRVQQLAREGIIPKAARGQYELVGCVQGYVRFLQERVDGGGTDRERLDRARAEEVELRLARAKGLLLDAEQVAVLGEMALGELKARLLVLPTKTAPLVVGCARIPQAKDILDEAIRDALGDIVTRMGSLADDARAAAEADRQRMG